MALITSQSFKPEVNVPEQKIAKEDIVRENAYGQKVLVVPKGQPIPDDLEPQVPIRNADDKSSKGEDKARRSSKGR